MSDADDAAADNAAAGDDAADDEANNDNDKVHTRDNKNLSKTMAYITNHNNINTINKVRSKEHHFKLWSNHNLT